MITWVIWKRVISTGNVSCRAEKAAKGFFFHPCCIKTECSPKPLQLMCLALFFFIFQGENALCCCLFVVLVPLSPQGQRHFWPLSICVISALPEPLNIKLPCQRTGGCKKFLGCVISCRNLNNSFSGNSWRGSVQLFCPQLLLLGFSISAVTPVLGLSPFPCFPLIFAVNTFQVNLNQQPYKNTVRPPLKVKKSISLNLAPLPGSPPFFF